MRLTSLLAAAGLAMAACAGSQPLPTAQSAAVGGFVRHIDERYAISLLRPASWTARDLGQARLFTSRDGTMSMEAVNYAALLDPDPDRADPSVGGAVAQLELFRADPTIEGWAHGNERLWQGIGQPFRLLATTPTGRIYLLDQGDETRVVALVVAGDPMALSLTSNDDLDELRASGMLDDFETMLESLTSR